VRTYFECLPCALRGTIDALRRVTFDEAVQERVLRGVLRAALDMDFRRPPPVMGQLIHRLIRDETGNPDPYREAKERLNGFALELLPDLRRRVQQSGDPFEAAARLAAAGNIIDLAAKSGLEEPEVRAALDESLDRPLDPGAVAGLRLAAEAAREILYIGDNAGEIVLDRLLVERLGPEKVVFAVRGGPTINDATRADAGMSGMADLVEIVDSGSDAPGTILEDCSEEFRQRFREADLVLAKGQGNYETLSGRAGRRGVFFLLRAKCPVVARDVGCPVGSLVLMENGVEGEEQ
jgi:uncharacterized protein with ATP-grasp and redox domains